MWVEYRGGGGLEREVSGTTLGDDRLGQERHAYILNEHEAS